MFKRIAILPTVLLLFLSPSFAQDTNNKSEGEEPAIPAVSVIRGRVVYEDSGLPVRRATIGLIETRRFSDVVGSKTLTYQSIVPERFVLTDENGNFKFRHVMAGSYYPSVNMPNVFSPQSLNRFYGTNSGLSFAKLSTYFEKITVDGFAETQVLVSVKRGGAISGRVLYADGSPVVAAKVEVLRTGTESSDEPLVSVNKTMTDDLGSYRLTELPPGRYLVRMSEPAVHKDDDGDDDYADRFTYGSELKTFFPSALSFKKAQQIEIDWGLERSGTDITIPDRRLFTLAGAVVSKETKKPLKNIAVTFERLGEKDNPDPDADDNSTNRVTSDAQGNWSFKDLPRGLYRLEISSCLHYICNEESTKNEVMYAKLTKELEVIDKNLNDIKIELPDESSVSGTVFVEGKKTLPNGLDIYLVDEKHKIESSTSFYSPKTDDKPSAGLTEWNFRVGMLGEGPYSIVVRAGDTYYVKSISVGGRDLTYTPFDVKEKQALDGVKIVLGTDVGELKAKVAGGNDNNSVGAVLVLLLPIDPGKQEGLNPFYSGRSDMKGEVSIKAEPGEYYVVIHRRDAGENTKEWIERLTKNAEKVTIKPGQTTSVNLAMPTQ